MLVIIWVLCDCTVLPNLEREAIFKMQFIMRPKHTAELEIQLREIIYIKSEAPV